MFFSKKIDFVVNRRFLRILKETVLQALFPRVCPVCGEILKLPSGWKKELTDPSYTGTISPKKSRRLRSILICKDCLAKINYVSGPTCRICSKPVDPDAGDLCDLCMKKSRSFDRGFALLFHDDTAKKILYDLKFRNRRDNADWVGFEMALHFAGQIQRWKTDVLIPVPLHKKRMRERGFNQTLLIAQSFSFWLEKLFGIRVPVNGDYLLRTVETKPQRTLEAGRRAGNVQHAFSISGTHAYRSVVLVDDIFTSGSTLNACAEKMKEAGCKHVRFITASIVS